MVRVTLCFSVCFIIEAVVPEAEVVTMVKSPSERGVAFVASHSQSVLWEWPAGTELSACAASEFFAPLDVEPSTNEACSSS